MMDITLDELTGSLFGEEDNYTEKVSNDDSVSTETSDIEKMAAALDYLVGVSSKIASDYNEQPIKTPVEKEKELLKALLKKKKKKAARAKEEQIEKKEEAAPEGSEASLDEEAKTASPLADILLSKLAKKAPSKQAKTEDEIVGAVFERLGLTNDDSYDDGSNESEVAEAKAEVSYEEAEDVAKAASGVSLAEMLGEYSGGTDASDSSANVGVKTAGHRGSNVSAFLEQKLREKMGLAEDK